MCVPNINPSMASTTCILASTAPSTTASRARHFSAPANLVKPTTKSSSSPKLLISSSCRMQRSCRIRPKSKEVGDSPSDSSSITVLESNGNHYLDLVVPYNPASTTMVQCQITCRPTPVISREKNKKSVNHFMSEEEACCWNNYNNIVDPKTPFNNKFPHHNPNVSVSPTQKNHYHHSSSDDRNVRLKTSPSSSEHFRNTNENVVIRRNGHSRTGNDHHSCLWNDSSGSGFRGNFVNPEDHSWNSGLYNFHHLSSTFGSTTTTTSPSPPPSPPLVSKIKSKKSCHQNIITSSTTLQYQKSTTAILSDDLDYPSNLNFSRSAGSHQRLIIPSSRSWLLLCFSLTLVLSLCVESSQATKICHSMNIAGVKGDVMKKFENLTDCTIIEGHLIVASFQEKDNFTLTFPNLREVTEYVVFYEAQNIVKLDQMFPKLAVIRGNKLLSVRKVMIIFFPRLLDFLWFSIVFIFSAHNGPEKLKMSRPKKLVKSNKSISRNFFWPNFIFLQFQK